MERIYHTWDKWECYPAGFYENHPPKGWTDEESHEAYANFLRDTVRFTGALDHVIEEWHHSCEHYLTNERMNRIAWLGQAAMCYDTGVPSKYRGGYMRLTDEEKREADLIALKALNTWLTERGEAPLTLEEAGSKTQMDLY